MRQFTRLASNIDVVPALLQLNRHPELWNANRARKDAPGSPHSQMDDIWVRYRDPAELVSPESHREPHHSVWYPAFHALPALRPIIMGVAARCEAVHVGGVLITRIPPGGCIAPHHDRGPWHAEYHNCKAYVPLQTNPRCVYICEDEPCVMQTGDCWTFDNLKTHSVHNDGKEDRITLIISLRAE